MAEFLLSFLVIAAVILAMAVGVLRGRAPIAGSCGGLNNLGVDGACEICGGDTRRCEEQSQSPEPRSTSSFYNAADS